MFGLSYLCPNEYQGYGYLGCHHVPGSWIQKLCDPNFKGPSRSSWYSNVDDYHCRGFCDETKDSHTSTASKIKANKERGVQHHLLVFEEAVTLDNVIISGDPIHVLGCCILQNPGRAWSMSIPDRGTAEGLPPHSTTELQWASCQHCNRRHTLPSLLFSKVDDDWNCIFARFFILVDPTFLPTVLASNEADWLSFLCHRVCCLKLSVSKNELCDKIFTDETLPKCFIREYLISTAPPR